MLKFGGSPCLLSGRTTNDKHNMTAAEGRRGCLRPTRSAFREGPIAGCGQGRLRSVRDPRSRPSGARPLGRSPGGRSLHTTRGHAAGRAAARAQCREGRASRRPTRRSDTDPEPDMDGGRASVRNVRSKCRCSHVLQFTFRRAVCCVLHRPPSQVIHCTVLFSHHSLSLSLLRLSRAHWSRTSSSRCCDGDGSRRQHGECCFGGSNVEATLSRATVAGQTGPRPRESNVGKPRTPGRPPDEGSGGPGECGQPPGTTTTSTGSGPSPRGGYAAPADGPDCGAGSRGGQLQRCPPGRPPTTATTTTTASRRASRLVANDPTAGSPTVTLLRLLLPLNAQVWKSSRADGGGRPRKRPAPRGPVQMPH